MQYKELLASGALPPPNAAAPMGMDTGFVQANQLTRQARRLYVGNIPFGITEQELAVFFEDQVLACIVYLFMFCFYFFKSFPLVSLFNCF